MYTVVVRLTGALANISQGINFQKLYFWAIKNALETVSLTRELYHI